MLAFFLHCGVVCRWPPLWGSDGEAELADLWIVRAIYREMVEAKTYFEVFKRCIGRPHLPGNAAHSRAIYAILSKLDVA